MDYMYGRVQDLYDTAQEQGVVNSCHAKIMHAHFNNGLRPSAVLKKSNIDNSRFYYTAVVLHDFVDYFYLPQTTKLFSGSSGIYNEINGVNYYEKRIVVEDASMLTYFSLVDFETFKYF